ncbi:MAG TPA: DVUA0089 family protein [Bryobacteraceae bacterium]|nr:DVUA0089 family protein [Bryobacteraceae bacterium]
MRLFARRFALAAFITCVFAETTAFASSFSFTGTFTTDDQLQEISFSLASLETITTVTYGYAGGTNQAGTLIPEGGFDPYLVIFDSAGNYVQSDDNGTCGQVPMDSVTGACFDSYISQPLAPGNYTLVLSESPNAPVDNQLADGYTETGSGDFTGGFYGCTDPAFCDANGYNRSGNWAVDIDNVTTAGTSPVPEPVTLPVAGAALVAISIWRRRSAV